MLFEKDLKTVNLIFFGRLEERKGLRTFVEAIKQLDPITLKKIHITFLGKVVSLFSAELKELNSEQYIQREFEERVSYNIISNFFSKQANEYIKSLDHPIICLTSPQENFPNTALEMGQIPAVLVVSDTGGFRETLQLVRRTSGLYWFRPKDSLSLAEAIEEAIGNHPEEVSVVARDTLEQINSDLLDQKLDHIEKAFTQISNKQRNFRPKITICLNYYNNQVGNLIDCLSRIESQSYENIEVIVIDDGSKDQYSKEIFDQAVELFYDYKFLRLDKHIGLGSTFNHAFALSSGDYCLFLQPNVLLLPFAIEKFAEAAINSGADIVTCSRKQIGSDSTEKIVSFSGGAVPLLFKSISYEGVCSLFTRSFLETFRHCESIDISNPTWEIIVAATATGRNIVYFPYPLYEYRTEDIEFFDARPNLKEQYSVRQYLSKIAPADWSSRQIYLLLTAVQQLQNQLHNTPSPGEVDWLKTRVHSLESELQKLTDELSNLQNPTKVSEAEELKKLANSLENQVRAMEVQVDQARGRVTAMETSKFWKLRKAWFKVKRRIGLPDNE
jgi:glycosyltransferase involved in cell wall biosynthesis